MKKKISILLVICCLLAGTNLILLAKETEYDFRKTNWGMSKEQVRATEEWEPDLEEHTILSYKVTVSEKDFECAYLFLEDKLYGSRYLFLEEHANKNLYIDDYEELKEVLTKKYGKPKIDQITWENDLLKNLERSHAFISELKKNIEDKEKRMDKLKRKYTREKRKLKREYADRLTILAERKAKLDTALAEMEQIWLDADKEEEPLIMRLEEQIKRYQQDIRSLYREINNSKIQLAKKQKDLEEEYADDISEVKEEKNKLATLLAEKETEYTHSLSLMDEQSRGLAISMGDLNYQASWETATTKIDLMLSGDNDKINLILSYISKELEAWVRETKEKEASIDF